MLPSGIRPWMPSAIWKSTRRLRAASSTLLPSLVKGPKGQKKLIDPSSAHQIFGRAGRPQFDKEGFVFALAHEDDVKISRWREKYDQIPEDTKDPAFVLELIQHGSKCGLAESRHSCGVNRRVVGEYGYFTLLCL